MQFILAEYVMFFNMHNSINSTAAESACRKLACSRMLCVSVVSVSMISRACSKRECSNSHVTRSQPSLGLETTISCMTQSSNCYQCPSGNVSGARFANSQLHWMQVQRVGISVIKLLDMSLNRTWVRQDRIGKCSARVKKQKL